MSIYVQVRLRELLRFGVGIVSYFRIQESDCCLRNILVVRIGGSSNRHKLVSGMGYVLQLGENVGGE